MVETHIFVLLAGLHIKLISGLSLCYQQGKNRTEPLKTVGKSKQELYTCKSNSTTMILSNFPFVKRKHCKEIIRHVRMSGFS